MVKDIIRKFQAFGYADGFSVSAIEFNSWRMEKGKALIDSTPYKSAVGSLMYAMIGLRTDLGFAVGLVSMFMSKQGRDH